MRNFKRILFPVEFSPECEKAATHVAHWARTFNASVIMLHVDYTAVVAMEGVLYVPESPTSEAVIRLNEFALEVFEDLKVERVLRTGDAATEIIKYVRNEDIDLIMMPTHGFGLFRRFILGSVTAKVLHDAPCPVWTSAHLQEQEVAAAPDLSRIVCAVDLDEAGAHTLRYAGGFARPLGSSVTIAHAIPSIAAAPDGYFDEDLRADLMHMAKEQLREMQVDANMEGTECIGAGNIAEFVAHAARSHKAGLVIIGRGTNGGLGRLRTNDYGIIRESGSPVVSI